MNLFKIITGAILCQVAVQAHSAVIIDGQRGDWEGRHSYSELNAMASSSIYTDGNSLFISYIYGGDDSPYIPISTPGGQIIIPNKNFNSVFWVDLDMSSSGKGGGLGNGAELEIIVTHSAVTVNAYNTSNSATLSTRTIHRSGSNFEFASSDDLKFWEMEIFLDEIFPPQYSSRPFFRDINVWIPIVTKENSQTGEITSRSGLSTAEIAAMIGYDPSNPFWVLREETPSGVVTVSSSVSVVAAEAEFGIGLEIDASSNSAEIAPFIGLHSGTGNIGLTSNMGFYPNGTFDSVGGNSVTVAINGSVYSYSYVMPATTTTPLDMPQVSVTGSGTGYVVGLGASTPTLPLTAQFGQVWFFRAANSSGELINVGEGRPETSSNNSSSDSIPWPQADTLNPVTNTSCRRFAC